MSAPLGHAVFYSGLAMMMVAMAMAMPVVSVMPMVSVVPVAAAALAMAAMGLAALLLAIDAGILARQDQLLGQGIELRELFSAEICEDLVGGLVVGSFVLLGKLAAFVGQLDGVGLLFIGFLDGYVTVALSLADDALQHSAAQSQDARQLALGCAVVVKQHAQQGALTALVALWTVLAEGETC